MTHASHANGKSFENYINSGDEAFDESANEDDAVNVNKSSSMQKPEREIRQGLN